MKKGWKRWLAALALGGLVLGLTGCGETSSEGKTADTSEVANEYYLDLSDLGMNLTVYLRLDQEGSFIFSNTLSFETNKSSGTFQESDGAYIMVFDSVNGEEKSVSDGLTSSFEVLEDGSLDFSGCDSVYYGSAHIMTKAEDDPDIKLIGVVVPEDYDEPDTDSDFQAGSYGAETSAEGVTYQHAISFYEDGTYLHVIRYEEDGRTALAYETGEYGVSTTQLALEPGGGDRISCEILDGETLNVSVYPCPEAEERELLEFAIIEEPQVIAELSGAGEGSGDGEAFDVTVKLYSDGSYESTAEDFTETGVLAVSTAEEYIKQYPDHPETGIRGLNQVATVPVGTCTYEDGALALEGLRVRKSAGLARYACSVTE